ncbi:uncharacterized protein N7473_009921 [Penicillium subrubescens]|uniref:uncharacterized protein n=1 Tax=Penicillium subrubescens TaxID=1316194 RepID=UPI00254514E4|nr:uncharacterized protein N7473_009921 [Penicillium subrubescens]KAJ5883035.1 hypothetical protein N7473_009921 [Penicillium subrubescens]
MLPTGQDHTQPPCPYTLPTIFTKQSLSLFLTLGITSLALVLLLVLLLLHIARHYHRPATATTLAPHHLSQMDAMEKGRTSPMTTTPPPQPLPQSPTPPPPSSACDVLQPLSQSGVFPSSGAVAARARELMQMQMQTGKASPSSPGMMMGGSETEESEVAAEGEVGGVVIAVIAAAVVVKLVGRCRSVVY